jgi:hypothetical protein
MPPTVLKVTLASSRRQAYAESIPDIVLRFAQPPATPCVLT